MQSIDLSVIVTCYNIQDYLGDCLRSIAQTNFPQTNLEVLMVDDGSTDRTTQIVDEFDRKYPQFHALHKQNGGPSLARNYGIDHASGRYIAFVDGDDLVPPDAYSNLVYTAETYHSQVVVGFVKRFDNLRCHGSYLHKFAVKDNEINTDLDHDHNLLYDTTTWNKVYSRDFLNRNHLRFIPHIIYEDLPFTLAVHLHARRVSTIKDVVYYWRWRSNSITQSRKALSNFKSRIHSLELCRQLLLKAGYHRTDGLFQDFLKKVLGVDLHIYLENIGDSEDSYIYQVQEIIYRFLRDWHLLHSPYLKQLPVKDQILYYAIKTGNFPLLKKFTYIKNKDLGSFKHQRFTKHYQYEIPGISPNVMRYLNVRDNTLTTTQKLGKLFVDTDRHLIYGSGMFKIRHLPLFKRHFKSNNYRERITAALINLNNHQKMPIHFVRKRTATYKRVLHPQTTWTNSRYYFSFNYVRAAKALTAGTWMIRVRDVIDDKYWVVDELCSPSRASHKLFRPLLAGALTITDDFNTNWQLVFKVQPRKLSAAQNVNWIKRPVIKDGQLCFDAGLINASELVPVITFDDQHLLNGTITPQAGHYQLSFPLKEWPLRFFQRTYSLHLIHRRTNQIVNYHFPAGRHFELKPVDRKHQVLITYDSRSVIRIGLQCHQLVVEKYSFVHRRGLRIVARLKEAQPLREWHFNHLKIEMVSHSLKHRYLLTAQRHQLKISHHQIIFTIPLLSNNMKQLLTLSGRYRFIVYLPIDNLRAVKTGVTIKNSLTMKSAKHLPIKTRDQVTYQIKRSQNGKFKLIIRQPWVGLDRSRSYRALAYSVIYPLMRMLPLRNTMVFDSYWSSQFSSNERSIYRYVREHYPKIKTVWFFHNRQTPISGKGIRVKTNSLRYWYYLATAKYLIQNTNFPDQYFKRAGQIEVETLHGTFLKHMGFDEPHFKKASRRIQDNFARRIRRWDYMVVPSHYMKVTASKAFDYHQKIIPAGFPRNDNLSFHNNANYINSIKKKLNIPLNKKVIMYAPTYRKHQRFDFPLDLTRLEHELTPNYVLLVRLHYFVAHAGDFYDRPGFVYDVSDYPDINDLYLISDVLITDYSSVMFDYAYLKRPMIFYAYDERWYLDDRNRGTYLDYDHEMPGPIVTNETDLIKVLKNLDQVEADYHDRIIKFANRFAQYGRKGTATKQVVDTILQTKKRQLDQVPDHHVIFNKFWHWFQIQDFQAALLNYLGRVLPKKNIIMFESFFGTKYSDNPKALYLYIKKHYPQYKLYWNVNSADVPYFKAHHIPYITRFGYRGILKQARAKYWITNARRPFRWHAPKGTTILQTWHGTPLKTIGADVSLVTMPGNNAIKYHQQVYNDNRRWDYLLAPNLYSERIMRRAFRKDANQMMLTGYPRNDILINATPQMVKRIKQNLGIDPHKKVILYAPTWRDDEFVKSDEFVAHLHLDLDQFKRHYGHKVVVLVRTHYMISNHLDLSKYRDIAINVSNYQDIAELYLISDVLITDYSSVMFDYAILKRPMIFFDYDFKNYAESTRGFYFDFRKIAPGPIVTTTHQVIQKLDPILNDHWRMNDNYRRFIKEFAQWMDGQASARVVHQLFSHHNVNEHRLTRQELQLPESVRIKDGAAMWQPKKDFKDRYDVSFDRNYDANGHSFKVIKGMQLHSVSFDQPLGMKYVLIQDGSTKVWISYNDVVLK